MSKLQISNPFRPETTITLADGVARKFKWTGESQILSLEFLLAQPAQKPVAAEDEEKLRLRRALAVAKHLLMILFAGLAADARGRGESWTVERVAELMPTERAKVEELFAQLSPLIVASQSGPGESGASGGASGRPPRSKGKPGRKR